MDYFKVDGIRRESARDLRSHAAAAFGQPMAGPANHCATPGGAPAERHRDDPIYNALPPEVVLTDSVSNFQGLVQGMVLREALRGTADWKRLFSCRVPLDHDHPLVRFMRHRGGDA
jgi:hypothetical protein